MAIKDNTLVIRLPWGLLNFRDPSQREIMGSSLNSAKTTEGISFRIIGSHNGEIVSLPENQTEVKTYSWDSWNTILYDERTKESYDIIKNYFKGL